MNGKPIIIETQKINEMISVLKHKGDISDGSHTFDELYYHRMLLTAVICKAYPQYSWKSKLHDDGTMFPNYFIVGFDTPEGNFSYHYHMEHWNHFKDVKELKAAPPYDGHEAKDITRLLKLDDMKKKDFNAYPGK